MAGGGVCARKAGGGRGGRGWWVAAEPGVSAYLRDKTDALVPTWRQQQGSRGSPKPILDHTPLSARHSSPAAGHIPPDYCVPVAAPKHAPSSRMLPAAQLHKVATGAVSSSTLCRLQLCARLHRTSCVRPESRRTGGPPHTRGHYQLLFVRAVRESQRCP
jgi:hypothetical protein